MLREEMEWVKEIAHQIAKEEIALALTAFKPVAKAKTPEPAVEEAKAEAPIKRGK